MENDNITTVLTRFIKALDIPVTRQSISGELQKHPDNGSLLAYSDVLSNWQVPNAAYKVPHDELADVPVPFIAFLKNKQFALVSKLDEKEVTISQGRLSRKVLALSDFKKQFAGSVLVAEKKVDSGEADYSSKRRKEIINDLRLPVFFSGALAILLGYLFGHVGYLNAFTIPVTLLTLFKTAGLSVTILLLIQSFDANNPLVQKLCGGDDNKNCNAILSSKAAKVNDYLTWSEAGFFYFAGTWLVLLFNSGHTAVLQMLALLNIIALPYTLYSVYYQWRVAKQWCVFCCTVQALLWLEFFAFVPYLLHGLQQPTINEWGNLAMGVAAPVLLWLFIKPYLVKLTKVQPLTQQLAKFKYSQELFGAALKEQPKYAIPADEWSIVLGNVEADNVFTMVSNPYCQPCAKAHAQIEEALNNLADIQVRVIFVGDNTDLNNDKTKVHRHLMALNELADKTIIKNALNDWYSQKQKNYNAWAKAYPAVVDAGQNHKLEQQKAWCTMAEIKATPTLLVIGCRLPGNYQLHELKYMLGSAEL